MAGRDLQLVARVTGPKTLEIGDTIMNGGPGHPGGVLELTPGSFVLLHIQPLTVPDGGEPQQEALIDDGHQGSNRAALPAHDRNG